MKKKILNCFSFSDLSYRNRILGCVTGFSILVLLLSIKNLPETFTDEQRINMKLFTATLLIIFGIIPARFINRVNRKVEKISFDPSYKGNWRSIFELIKLAFYLPVSVGIVLFIIMIYFVFH